MTLRALVPLSVALAISAVPAIAQASGPLHGFSTLDYSRRHDAGSIVFVPLLTYDSSYEKGITFYTSYFNDVQTPVALSSTIKSVEVIVTPTAHRGDEAEYNDFFTNTTRVDAQEYWFTSSNPCAVTSELAPFTNGLPPELQPVVRGGGYPQACYVRVYYRPVQEAALLSILNANRGITLQDDLPFCQPSSPIFQTRPLISALESTGVLVEDANGNVTGSWRKLVHQLDRFKKTQPGLLGGAAAAINGASVFLRDAVDFTAPDSAAILPDYLDTPQTACNPVTFPIRYGF